MGGTTSTSTRNVTPSPYGPAAGPINQIIGQVPSISTGPTPTESGALDQLTQIGQAGNPFAGQIGNVATRFLSGGGAIDYAPLINQGLQQYETGLAPFLNPNYLDPRSNPYLQPVLDTLTSDITNQIRGQYAGAGRPFSGYENQTIARGLGQGRAPALLGQYNTNVATQPGALGNRAAAVANTGQTLGGLNQAALANMQAGVPIAGAANQAQLWGPQTVLAAEAARRGIPLQTLAQEMGIVLPAGQAFGPSTADITTATPFNPWSLAGLAFMPLGGTSGVGSSLAGRALGGFQ